MRIRKGRLKGNRLPFKPRAGLRPTSDKVRQSVLNVLHHCLSQAHILDCYSGTGLIGFEALSCGASDVVFVEHDARACRELEAHSKQFKVQAQVRILACDVMPTLIRLKKQGLEFDIVFADPPYDRGLSAAFAAHLERAQVLKLGGWCVLEHRQSEVLPAEIGVFRCKKISKFGDKRVSYYQHCTRNDHPI